MRRETTPTIKKNGLLFLQFLSIKKFWNSVFLIILIITLIAVSKYIFQDISYFLVVPITLLFAVGIVVYIEKIKHQLHQELMFKISLEGKLPSEKLNILMNEADKIVLEPNIKNITVMSIDMAGISLLAEEASPDDVFVEIKKLLETVTLSVHENHGTVLRQMGDRILCFFGPHFVKYSGSNLVHAEQALKCATEIQYKIFKRDLQTAKSDGYLLPLKIGISTGESCVINLGNENKLDFTVLGHSVNFAQRLCEVCENYRVMSDPVTYDCLSPFSEIKKALTRKLITASHQDELVESYELDPFFQNSESIENQKELNRKFSKNYRTESRWPVVSKSIELSGNICTGIVTNFSKSGFAIESSTYLGKGTILNFTLNTSDRKLEAKLRSIGITEFSTEVRWSWNDGKIFHHGLKILNLNNDVKELFFHILRTYQDSNSE